MDDAEQAQSVLDDGTFFIKSGSTIDLFGSHFKKINQDNLKWLFTNAGTYEITVKATGSKDGKEVTSQEETFTWVTQGTPNSADSAANENESTTAPTEDPAGSSPGDTSNTEGAETESPNLDPHDSHADSEADASTENNPAAESSTGARTDAITLNDGHVDMFYIYGEPGKLHLC
ncbi:TIGR03769 domain-containing protein [Arcanobacterium hippocoleae]|uniref:TIGR03769 domain-containing protein n=1 Tax=Arcanobacterium hippocoleae TaxID=149017 RepID=UPI00333E5415